MELCRIPLYAVGALSQSHPQSIARRDGQEGECTHRHHRLPLLRASPGVLCDICHHADHRTSRFLLLGHYYACGDSNGNNRLRGVWLSVRLHHLSLPVYPEVQARSSPPAQRIHGHFGRLLHIYRRLLLRGRVRPLLLLRLQDHIHALL